MFGMVENILANCDGNLYLPILHLPRVELHYKLRGKLHRMTGSYHGFITFDVLRVDVGDFPRSVSVFSRFSSVVMSALRRALSNCSQKI